MPTPYKTLDGFVASFKEALAVKNILTRRELIDIIRIDFERINYALLEWQHRDSFRLITACLEENYEIIEGIPSKDDVDVFCHLGFKIYEPIDIALVGFTRWIERFNSTYGTRIEIDRHLRFSASPAFQARFKAPTEIMRIWLKLDDRRVMLELFDIHRAFDISKQEREARIGRESVIRLLRGDRTSSDCSGDLPAFLREDETWHYAVAVESADIVRKLHDQFTTLVKENDQYLLPFGSTVYNKYDDSFYTRLRNKANGIDIEFASRF